MTTPKLPKFSHATWLIPVLIGFTAAMLASCEARIESRPNQQPPADDSTRRTITYDGWQGGGIVAYDDPSRGVTCYKFRESLSCVRVRP